MRERWPGWTLPRLAAEGFKGGTSSENVDFMQTRPGAQPRALPFGMRALADTISPAEALPALFGGGYGGEVVWLDDLWAVSSLSEEHLWSCTASVCAPLAAAVHANFSAGLSLPPLHNLLLAGGPSFSRPFAWDGWHNGRAFWHSGMPGGVGWCWGFLTQLLKFAGPEGDALPFLGSGRHEGYAPGGFEGHYRSRAQEEERSPAAALSTLLFDILVARPEAAPPPPGAKASAQQAEWEAVEALLAGMEGSSSSSSRGTGAFPGAAQVEAAMGELLGPCLKPPLRSAADMYASPPGQAGTGWTPHAGVTFDQHVYLNDASDLAFNASAAAPWSLAMQRWRATLWCLARTLITPQSRVKLPFSALFFRDARQGGSGGSSPSPAHAGRSTRLLFTARDLLYPLTAQAALQHALESALEVLGEDVAGAWSSALAEEVQRRRRGAEGGGDPRPLPLHASPYADGALGGLQSVPALQAAAHFFTHGRRTRVCARRAVLPGMRDIATGGLSEANYLREFAHRVREATAPGQPRQGPTLVDVSGSALPSAYDATPAAAAAAAAPPPDGFIGRMHELPILLLDRGQRDNGFSVVGPWGRRFANLPGMLAVLDKYELNYTVVEDVDLLQLTFEAQVALFNAHRVFIAAHGAGLQNALFLPPRSAVIEITPRGMWCPLFFRQVVAAGHFAFPIHSLLLDAQQQFAYSSGLTSPSQQGYNESAAWHESACVARGHFWSAQTNSMCFHEAKTVPVVTPLHEFEAALLHALDAVGGPLAHRGSAHHLLEGIPSQAEAEEWRAAGVHFPWAGNKTFYAQRAWLLTPPRSGAILY